MWEANEDNLESIAMGAGILGTGGGGNPYIGQLRARQAIRERGPVRILDPEELPEDLATNQTVAGTSWSCAAATRQSGPRMTSGLTEEDLRCNGED